MTAATTAETAPVAQALAAPALVALLRRLVAVESVNPGTSENAMADAVAGALHGLPGVALHRVETFPGRESLAATLLSGRPGPRLVLNGHLDTVPIGDPETWTVDPFAGAERDGYVYGRGACDMKAGLVAQIAAARALAAAGGPRRGGLVLHFAVGEERAEPGTQSLCDAGFVGDVGIVTEPTSLRVAVAERGMACLRVLVRGRAGHASSPHEARNPLAAVADVLACVERYASARGGTHPLLPPGTCTPTMLDAGVVSNAIPDTCELVFDRRMLPGQTLAEELHELRAALRELAALHPELTFDASADPYHFAPAEIAPDAPFARLVNDARAAVCGDAQAVVGTPFSSDVHVLVNEAGMEAVTFGPGEIRECHCADERVAVGHLEAAARTLHHVARELLN